MGGDYKGTKIGKLGYASSYSLHTMKNMTTLSEGGLVVTDDSDFAAWARRVRMYGRSVGAWVTSNVMTKVQAAVGLVQLKKLDSFIANLRRVAAERNELLSRMDAVMGDRKFIHDRMRDIVADEFGKAIADKANTGKADKEIFEAVTKDQGYFASMNPPAGNMGGAGNIDDDAAHMAAMRAAMGLPAEPNK
jgi:dTDP-4-amino-4,6-dideoxygalactose transaminase